MPSGSTQYVLWRRDERGNTVLVCRFHSRKQAERACACCARRGVLECWVTRLQPAGTSETPRPSRGNPRGNVKS